MFRERAEAGPSTVHTERAQLALSSIVFQVNKAPGEMRRKEKGGSMRGSTSKSFSVAEITS